MRIIALSIVALSLSVLMEGNAFGNNADVSPNQCLNIVANADDGTESDVGGDSYPRVSLIENAILGKTFPNDDLGVRIERLESRAFGKASSNPDLGDRTDELQNYAEKKLGKRLMQEEPGYESALDDATNGAGDGGQPGSNPGNDAGAQAAIDQQDEGNGEYPHITELEDAILHKTFAGDKVEDRLGRLESTAFGAASTNPDLSVRIDKLDDYAEKKLHLKPHQQDESEQADSKGGATGGPAPNRMRQVGTMVGTTMLNIAGMGVPGFGGVRVRNRADVPPEELNRQAPEPQDDPVVFQVDPPGEGVKFINKVGWCEVQVFGHTFPNLHLPQRLSQLNNEIKFAPNRTGISLMDSTDEMIKAAQIHKHAQSLSNSQPPEQH